MVLLFAYVGVIRARGVCVCVSAVRMCVHGAMPNVSPTRKCFIVDKQGQFLDSLLTVQQICIVEMKFDS